MLTRWATAVAPFLAWGFVFGCGSTTTVSGPVDDAGCPTIGVGHDVVEPPEGGVVDCPTGVCNYQSQAGCPAGQACRPQFTATSTDVAPGCEAAGSGTSGTACTHGSDCAAGYFCVVLDPTQAGACRKQCCGGDWLACDPGQSCIRQSEVKAGGGVVDGGVVVDTGMELCFPVNNCDPLDPKPCPGDEARECKIVDPTGAVACEPLSDTKAGDSCDASTFCAAGLFCVARACRKLCRADACGEPACTAADGTCVHFNRDPAGVGECTP